MEKTDLSEVSLCLTFDICNAIFPEHRESRRWDEIICTGIRLEETLSSIRDDWGKSPSLTWFVRADPWMRRRFKSSTFLFERHAAHLARLNAMGHEIAWHPHLDVLNLKREMNELPAVAEQVRDFFPVTSVRSGEGFHSNQLMELFDKLEFRADSTALPGRYNLESKTPFDWQLTSEYPYYPDINDYRTRDLSRTSYILEIPFTMLPIRLPHDRPGPSARYMNFSFKPDIFQIGILSKKDWKPVIVGIIHPAEVLPPRDFNRKHDLLSFSEYAPSRNLLALLDRLRSMGIKVRFSNIRDTEMRFRESQAPLTFIESRKEAALAQN
jgi:hypothetical protein